MIPTDQPVAPNRPCECLPGVAYCRVASRLKEELWRSRETYLNRHDARPYIAARDAADQHIRAVAAALGGLT